MSTNCIKKNKDSKRISIGAMDRKILLNTRSITTPSSGSVDFSESFTDEKELWAYIETAGETNIFDDSNQRQSVSHNIYIRYIASITPEKWIILKSINSESDKYLNILRVENLNEQNRFYKLICNLRGDTSVKVNWA